MTTDIEELQEELIEKGKTLKEAANEEGDAPPNILYLRVAEPRVEFTIAFNEGNGVLIMRALGPLAMAAPLETASLVVDTWAILVPEDQEDRLKEIISRYGSPEAAYRQGCPDATEALIASTAHDTSGDVDVAMTFAPYEWTVNGLEWTEEKFEERPHTAEGAVSKAMKGLLRPFDVLDYNNEAEREKFRELVEQMISTENESPGLSGSAAGVALSMFYDIMQTAEQHVAVLIQPIEEGDEKANAWIRKVEDVMSRRPNVSVSDPRDHREADDD